ncbi:MAG: LysR family transcriptional regulator [Rhodospirillales bacterium]|nr:LysR family transcriptional regulator [Rhodospirillales bacterium]
MQNTDTNFRRNSLDLNLLRMLQMLLRTQSVTKAGENLGLSQPAASRVVAKLRYELNDPLLVRTRKGYVLTPLATSLREKVDEALDTAYNVFQPRNFAPLLSKREFKICTTDYGELAVINPFALQLEQIAPNISLELSPWNEDTFSSLERGEVDFALYSDESIPLDFHYRDLFEEHYVLILKKNHPLKEAKWETTKKLLAEVERYQMIAPRYPYKNSYITDDIYERLGGKGGHRFVSSPYFSLAPTLVAQSNAVALVPYRIASFYSAILPLDTIQIPTDEENFKYRLIWHERTHRDIEIKWLRDQIVNFFSSNDPLRQK